MRVNTELIKELRARTGAGIMACKKALEKTGGDIEKAVEELKKEGLLKAEKKLNREAKEGLVYAYIHPGSKVGAMVELNCETDFVANTDEFKQLAHDIAMQITAMSPIAVSREDIPKDVLEKEKEIYKEQLRKEGKPEHILDKIVEGKMEKYFKENVLLEQDFIKDPSVTIEELIKLHISKFGENIRVRRFCKFRIGEE